MNNIDKQRLHDFVEDMKLLAEQYGWELSDALRQIGYKQKTEDDLLLEVAKEKYKKGTVFYPLYKNFLFAKTVYDEDEPYWDGGKIWVNVFNERTASIYDKLTNTWAEIIN